MGSAPLPAAGSGRPVAQLVANCAACHRLDNRPTGIPPIIGLGEHQLVGMLQGFRARPPGGNIMRTVAGALSDDEIAALAAYLAAVRPDASPR